jgi:hypothetical protein
VIFVSFAWSLGMLAILRMDRLAVWRAITGRLRRQHYTAEPSSVSSRPENTLWSPGNGIHARNFETLVTDHVNCVVYRGSRPFVGRGNIVEPWSIAIALEPAQPNALLVTDAADGNNIFFAGRAENSMFGGQGNTMHTRYGGGCRAGRPGTVDSRREAG